MKILVTGFEPFGGERINPSEECIRLLPDRIGGAQISRLIVPVVWRRSLEVIEKEICRQGPDVILSVGQAGGRSGISLERIGVNLDDFRIPDNEGNRILAQPVFADGPMTYTVNLPVEAMAERIREIGIEAELSDSAGRFICNHVLYGIRYICERKYPGRRNGFIHLPYLPVQADGKENVPSMPLSDMVRGLTAALKVLAEG